SMGIVLENVSHLRELEDNLFATTLALAKTIEYKDPYTRGHCERVMGYSDAIALKIGFSEKDRKRLRYACILHDIGKIGIPGRILDKPGRLTDEEYEIVKRHSVLGEELVKGVPFLKEIALFIRWHHERWDGKGYPDGLKGYEIPLESRIMAIADAFDAMTSDRPYRKALSRLEAIEEIKRGSGSQFDPILASEFLKVIEGGEG
ncbi:MAG: HD-GYP domain-containing protein, partial [Planctomycetota bacterium]|nr:HD-GYP domain-containing protein [Planctomycetota bacterium]